MQLIEQPTLEPFVDAWDDLVMAQPMPSPFLMSWWLQATSRGEPHWLLAVDSDELVGGLALQRTRRAGLELLELMSQGPFEPDHLDIIAAPPHTAAVTRLIGGWLQGSSRRVVRFDGVVSAGRLATALPRACVVTTHTCPTITVPGDLEAWFAARPGRMRSTITRGQKRLDRLGAHFRRVAPSDVPAAMIRLGQLHRSRWGDKSALSANWTDLSAAVNAGSETGQVAIFELAVDDEDDGSSLVIASELHFDLGGRRFFYQSGRVDTKEWKASGTVLKYRVLADAVDHGIEVLDLLRGDEPYKADWADDHLDVVKFDCGFGAGRAALMLAGLRGRMVDQLRAPGRPTPQ